MNPRLRRPAGALLATVLAASVLGVSPAAHAANGTVSGIVTGSAGPLGTVSVSAYVLEGGTWMFAEEGYTSTDENGAYTLSLPPGDYRIGFWDYSGGHVEEFHADSATVEGADTITVGDSGSYDIDATLAEAAHITGKVTSADVALAGIGVVAYQERVYDGVAYWEGVQYADTDGAGNYDLGGLAGGTYRVGFEDQADDATYGSEFFDDQPSVLLAENVVVGAAGTVTGIDAQIALESTITGRVTDSAGAPLEAAYAYAYVQAGDEWDYVDQVATDTSGNYTLDGLGAGTYRVTFGYELSDDYLYESWNDKASIDVADDIVITTPRAVTGVDAQLVAGEHDIKFVEGVTLPVISGTPQVGSTLTASPGTWTPADITASYQWFRGEEEISGATSPAYTLTAADQGHYVWVGVIASYPGYADRFNMSEAVGPVLGAPAVPEVVPVPVPVAAPVPAASQPTLTFPETMKVKGALKVGNKLVLKKYTIAGAGKKATYKFQWYAGKKKIKNATKTKLKLTRALKGKKISVKVTVKTKKSSKTARIKVGKVR